MTISGMALSLLASAPQAGGGEIRTSLAEAFFIQRHPITGDIELLGSAITWLLMALSIGCLGLIGTLTIETRRERFAPRQRPSTASRAVAERAVEDDDSLFGIGARAALAAPDGSRDAMLHSGEEAIEQATLERLRKLEPLSIVGNVAPMMGLFGTVYGMILAFRQIVVAGGSPDPVELAAGIGTALTTTFWGLIVAIPALAGHAILRNRVDALTLEAWRRVEAFVQAVSAAPRQAHNPGETSRPEPLRA